MEAEDDRRRATCCVWQTAEMICGKRRGWAARPRERAIKAERGAGSAAAVPRSGAALNSMYGVIRQRGSVVRR
jgi:hypothetical protein